MSSFDFSRLSPQQRLVLISELWESLDSNIIEPTQAQQDDLDRRLAILDEDIQHGRDADDIIGDLRRHFR
jgi:putative addiction module component (TIGR02574 family)